MTTEPLQEPEATGQATAVDVAGTGDVGAVETPVVAPATGAVKPTTAETAVEVARPRRRTIILAGSRRALAFTFAIALFVGGVVLGVTSFQASRPSASVTDLIDPAASPPAVAQEFIRALGANDADALRSSLDLQPHKDITDEMERFGVHRVQKVETLGTEVDGTRSATEIMMMAENADGLPFGINLVILVDGGKIEGFR